MVNVEPSRLRVVFVVPSAHQNLEGWIEGLKGLGHDVHVAAVRTNTKKSGPMFRRLGVSVSQIPEAAFSATARRSLPFRDRGRRWFFPDMSAFAPRLENADLLIIRPYSVPLLIAVRWATRGTSAAVTLYEQHDPRPPRTWWATRRNRTNSLAALYGALRLRTLRLLLADGLMSPVTQTSIVEALTNPFVVPFGIAESPEQRSLGPEAVAPEKNPLRILMVARFEPRKRHELAVRSLECLLAAGIPARLRIVGQAFGAREELFREAMMGMIAQSTASDAIDVEINLSKEEVRHRYLASDVFLLAADREPASVAVVEAAASGLPVILPRTCGTACYVMDEVSGLHVDEGSVEQLTEALRRLAVDRQLVEIMSRASQRILTPITHPTAVARRIIATPQPRRAPRSARR
jgi:glycosyltransferase involved in cell wall biosynthesis